MNWNTWDYYTCLPVAIFVLSTSLRMFVVRITALLPFCKHQEVTFAKLPCLGLCKKGTTGIIDIPCRAVVKRTTK